MTLLAGLGVALVALVHLFVGRLRFLRNEGWRAASSGVGVSYVFLDVLPHLAAKQRVLESHTEEGLFGFLAHHAYLLSLVGLLIFLALASAARAHRERAPGTEAPPRIRAAVLAAFGGYNLLIGVLIGEQPEHRVEPPLLFALAISIHLAGVDFAMRENHLRSYDRLFRYVFAGAVAVGYGLAIATQIPPGPFALAFSFLAGAILTIAMAFEVPHVFEGGPCWRFVAGAAGFSALLLLYEALARTDLGT